MRTQTNINSLNNLTYRIPKGSTPWNKGLSLSADILDKMRVNQVIKQCEICLSEYRIKKSHADKRRSCSRACGAVIKKIEQSGKNHPMWGKSNISTKGDKNHNWKGGVTKEKVKIRNSASYKLWREEVYKRDDYTCQKCLSRGVYLEAHHIKPFSLYPDERFNIENGIALCKPCHKETDSYGSKIINYIKNLKQ